MRNPADDVFLMQEVWSPGEGVDLKHALIATWHPDLSLGTGGSRDADAEVTVDGEWPEDELIIRTGRLTMSNTPKYERRQNLTGVHFVVTSINVSNAPLTSV